MLQLWRTFKPQHLKVEPSSWHHAMEGAQVHTIVRALTRPDVKAFEAGRTTNQRRTKSTGERNTHRTQKISPSESRIIFVLESDVLRVLFVLFEEGAKVQPKVQCTCKGRFAERSVFCVFGRVAFSGHQDVFCSGHQDVFWRPPMHKIFPFISRAC